MKIVPRKLLKCSLYCSLGIIILLLLAYGVYSGIFAYTYYQDYRKVQHVKLLHIFAEEYNRCEMDLPIKFVPESHDAGVVQKLLVVAENRKSFMIFLYEDNHIQLLSMPIKKYPLIGIVTTYYDVTDAKSEVKLRKLLDANRKLDE